MPITDHTRSVSIRAQVVLSEKKGKDKPTKENSGRICHLDLSREYESCIMLRKCYVNETYIPLD